MTTNASKRFAGSRNPRTARTPRGSKRSKGACPDMPRNESRKPTLLEPVKKIKTSQQAGKRFKPGRTLLRRVSSRELSQLIYEAIDTPVSLGCSLRLKYGELVDLVGVKIDPRNYTSPHRFFLDYQAASLLSKSEFLKTGIDTKLVALRKFEECESHCAKVNERFFNGANFPPAVHSVLWTARSYIASVLGRCPGLEELNCSFGPGASFSVRGLTSPFQKLRCGLEATPALARQADSLREFYPGWTDLATTQISVVYGSELTFVPKNAKTDRPICIEPCLNGFVQKGIGTWMKHRLYQAGCDLYQQEKNQSLASKAHSLGLSTVDLSSASDCISLGLVHYLLPSDWLDLLDMVRSPYYLNVDGNWTEFSKFSSMGNAYTFELESLIFLALARSALSHSVKDPDFSLVSVYGDDIIIPTSAFGLFSEALEVCGFLLNPDKTFSNGVFFESCGKDFFFGQNVRPFFLREEIRDDVLGIMHACNSISSIAMKFLPFGRDVMFRRPYRYLETAIYKPLYGPYGYGDGHIHSDWDRCTPTHDLDGREGATFRTLLRKQRLKVPKTWAIQDAAYAIYRSPMDDSLYRTESYTSEGYPTKNEYIVEEQVLGRYPWPSMGVWW